MRPSPRRSGVIFERSLRPPIAGEGGAYAHRLPIKPNITTGNDERFVQQQAQRQVSDVRRPMTDLGRNIRDLLLQGSSVVVPAVAGSGKTSLALSVVQHLAPSQQRATLFLAFNREVIERLRPHVSLARMTTIHGLALRALGIMHPDLRVDGRKLHRIIESVIIRNRQHARLAHHIFDTEMSRKILADDLHALAVRMITRQESALMAAHVIRGHMTFPEMAATLVVDVISAMRDDPDTIALEEAVPWVLTKHVTLPCVRYVVVDEAQDLGPLDVELVLRLVRQSGAHVLILGDEHQAIYGFRGAAGSAMSLLAAGVPGIVERPLTTSHRCPTEVARLAQRLVSTFLPSPQAQTGSVTATAAAQWPQTSRALMTGDLVVCRTGAPLVPLAVHLQQTGMPVVIRATIGARLMSAVRRLLRGSSLPQSAWDAACRKRMEEAPIEQQDIFLALMALGAGMDHVTETTMEQRWASLISETGAAVCFATIHQAKGMEADTVVWVGPERIGLDERMEAVEEQHLVYVAITRARRRLILQSLNASVPDGDALMKRLLNVEHESSRAVA